MEINKTPAQNNLLKFCFFTITPSRILKYRFANRNGRKLLAIIENASVVTLLLMLLSTVTVSQQVATSYGGATPAGLLRGKTSGSYLPSDIESVNLFNGNASIAVPLLSVGGRGEAGYTIYAPLKTPQWIVESRLSYMCAEQGCPSYFASVGLTQPVSFFEQYLGYEPGYVAVRHIGTDYQGPNPYGYPEYYARTQTIVTFKGNDGSDHTLYDELQGGNVVSYYGGTDYPSLDRGRVFTAKDGSELSYISDEATNDWSNVTGDGTANGYLKTKEGLVYRINQGRVAWMRDRNGNLTTFSYVNYRLSTITDSNGRQVRFNYGNNYDQITYDGVDGADRTIQVNYSTVGNRFLPSSSYTNGMNLFPQMQQYGNSGSSAPLNFKVTSTITMQDGKSYQFYYNEYGEVAKLETPNSATIEYTYGGANGAYPSGQYGNVCNMCSNPVVIYVYRRLKERREFANGGSTPTLKTTYSETAINTSPQVGSLGVTEEQIDPSTGEKLSKTAHYFFDTPTTSLSATAPLDSLPSPSAGKELQTDRLNVVNNQVLASTVYLWQPWCSAGRVDCFDYSWSNHLGGTIVSILDTTTNQYKVAKKEFSYDKFNNLIETKEYDFGNGQVGTTLLRRTTISYRTDSYYIDPIASSHILGLAQQQSIYDATGVEQARTTYEYDNYTAGLTPRENITGYDGNFSTLYRGNPTSVTRWLLPNTPISQRMQYDISGNVVSSTDARSYTTIMDYDDRYGSSDNEARDNSQSPLASSGLKTYAFPTKVTNSLLQTVYIQYDYYTENLVNTEDANGVINKTVYEVNDLLDRPKQMVTAVGTSQESQSTFAYDDLNLKTTVTSDINSLNDNLIKAESFNDKFNRTIETRKYQSDGSFITTKMEYDSLGRNYRTTNPFRSGTSTSDIRWTKNEYDSLGRIRKTILPDETPNSEADNSVILTTYSGNSKTVTDQAGKKRRGITDALGRTVQVIEDPDGQNLVTSYMFDVLNNIHETVQGGQSRYFLYDSLGRVIRARQPEQRTNSTLNLLDQVTGNSQWSTKYIYDENGNLKETKDAKGTTIQQIYDSINRLTFRDYSDSTPDVTFEYDDQNIQFSKGSLTKIITGNPNNPLSVSKYNKLDALGKVTESEQITGEQNYQMGYSYNLIGSLVSERYPSGRIIRNEFETDGDLKSVRSFKGVSTLLASDFTYAATGAVERMRLGNGLWESAQYNSRLQVKQIGLGATLNDNNLLKLEFDYGSNSQNNSSVREQKISYAGLAQPIVQDYGYDSLNRLKSTAETNQGNSTIIWKQVFNYDRFGNRTFDEMNTTTLNKNCPVTSQNPAGVCQRELVNPQINESDNRFAGNQGYDYDSTGNLTADATGKGFVYDAQNRLISFGTNGTADNGGVYQYDGLGKRVKKIVPSEVDNTETVFVYDAFGKMVAEYENKQPAYTSSSIKYLTMDNLGTPRIITDQTGTVVARHDYMAFGEEIYAGIGSRTVSSMYSAVDKVRQQFTSYERDTESGLDYAQARFYNSNHGRFTSVDPLTASVSIKNPQTFNRYSYALNSPYKFTDPLGLSAQAYPCNKNTDDCEPGTSDPPEPAQTDSPYIPPPPIDSSLAGSPEYQERVASDIALNVALNEGIDEAIALLTNNPDSAKELFGTTDPIALINLYRQNGLITIGDEYVDQQSHKNTSFKSSNTGAVTNTATGSYPSSSGKNRISANPITVNAGGFFVSGKNSAGVPVGQLKGSGFEGITDINIIRALVVIHETAHAAGVIPEDGAGTTAGQSQVNSTRIKSLFVP